MLRTESEISGTRRNRKFSILGVFSIIQSSMRWRSPLFATCLAMFCGAAVSVAQNSHPTAQITVVDEMSRLLPCRIHVNDSAGKPWRAKDQPFWRDHFVGPGSVTLELPPGKYTYEVERGPEYEQRTGSFVVKKGEHTKVSVVLKRLANLSVDGWWSGDLHVHRSLEDIELLMQAEDLHVAPVITWWNDRNLWVDRELPEESLLRFEGHRYAHVMTGEDERGGGALIFLNLNRPLKIAGSSWEYPSSMSFVREARRDPSVWIDIEKPFWWDVPIWLASGQVDSIGLANNHMCRSMMYEGEASGRPRDSKRLPPPRGNGYWSQEIYYHILDSGLRIPPSAGSASGVIPNPVGYNRVYVHVGHTFNYAKWWSGLRAGRSFVTNGPLLICRANGHFPGHIFAKDESKEMSITLDVSVISRDPISSLEIIKNGTVESADRVRGRTFSGTLGPLKFRKSGWFLVRVITENPRTFRFASTAPYYVEIGPSKRRISRRSAQFFLDWVEERIKRVRLNDADERRQVLTYHEEARSFWKETVRSANVEGRSSVSVTLANDRDGKTAAVHSFTSERFVIQIDGIQPDSLAKARLDYIALRMQQIPRLSALVTGHTDDRGAEELNLRVGQRRADAMRDYLVRQHNLEAGRIETGSEGEHRPMVDNQAPEGRRQNRRVEIELSVFESP